VPPFGEAHNHNVEESGRLDAVLAAYRRAGVFYVQNPNSLPTARAALAARRADYHAPDVTFANGGLTGPGGHPGQIATAMIARGSWTAADGEGAFYHTVTDVASLDAAWRTLLATEPELVKVYLLYSDEYAARLADTSKVGWRGIDPALLPEIVRRARNAGVRVAAHVETAADFRTAVRAGVDMIAHLPGFRGDERTSLPGVERFMLTAEDAREAARKRVIVVTTASGLDRYASEQRDNVLRKSADRLHRANLTLLHDAGVRLAIGSDEYEDTSVAEALYLSRLYIFTKAELLEMWTETTPQAIYPARKIGRLERGFEASFLVLDVDPLVDFTAVYRIQRAVARGRELPRQ